ncbi:MAG: cell envelope integrity protein TolA [Thiobacillus sp.]
MNVQENAHFVSRPAPMFAAGALALGVHVLFALLLVFGVSWQTRQPAPVMVDLWEALPKPVPQVAPPPDPRPEPVNVPEPAEAVPAPEPEVKAPPPVKAPDIALEKKQAEAERLKKQHALQQAEEKARAEAARQAREKQLAEQKKRELLRQMEEEDSMRRMADEEAASAARQAQMAEARAAASKLQAEVASVVGRHRDLISAKVRGNTRLPANLQGNPEVRCLVKLLPTGEVQSVRVTQSSGNAAYDEAVMRAIEKSSPLPLPADREARAAFVPELSFVHRPKE